jgi:iron complex transport system permease protein
MRELLFTNQLKSLGLIIGFILVLLFMFASVIFGLTDIKLNMFIESFTNYNGSNEHIVIQHNRIPRAMIGAVIGASLAVSGALMQGLTRNPLASPSLFGINAGASFFIVVAVMFFSVSSLSSFKWFAFAGAALASVLVYFLGTLGREGLTPIKMTLAGAAIAAMFSSFTQGLLVLNEKALEEVLFWLAGSIEGRKLEMLTSMLPYFAAGGLASLLIAGKMNTLSMGEDVAKGLGQRTLFVKITAAVIVVLLAGSAVAIAGPIGFIGIVIPHIARAVAGIDYRWLIPYCALLGAMLLLFADISARYIIMPREVPVGVMTALIGVPFFVYIARRRMN